MKLFQISLTMEVFFFISIIFNSLLIIFNINNNLKFSISELVFCPAFGSVNRCDFISILSFICILSCLICIAELVLKNKNTKLVIILRKNKIFLIKIYILLWIILVFLLFKWSKQVEADFFEKFKNIFGSILNLILFVIILPISIKNKELELS